MNFGLARRAGAGLGLVGAMSGEVDMVISVVLAVAPYVKDGRRRALAVLDTKRVGSTPQVPNSAEAGLPQLVAVNWYVLLAPAATPRASLKHARASRGVPARGARAVGQVDPRRRHQDGMSS